MLEDDRDGEKFADQLAESAGWDVGEVVFPECDLGAIGNLFSHTRPASPPIDRPCAVVQISNRRPLAQVPQAQTLEEAAWPSRI